MHKHFLNTLLLAGLLMLRTVAAIDGNYAIPYAPGQDGTQTGTAMDSNYGRKNMELPMSTIVGGILVLVGAGSSVYWQMKSYRRRQAG